MKFENMRINFDTKKDNIQENLNVEDCRDSSEMTF